MRPGMTIAALCLLAWAAPLNLLADDGTDTPETQAEERESIPGGLESQLPDAPQLRSLLGTLIRHISAQRGGGDRGIASQGNLDAPQAESGSRITSEGNLLPPPPAPDNDGEIQAPPAPPQPIPVYEARPSRRGRHSGFSQRLLSRRMSLIERIRAKATASGDVETAARSEQLGAFVLELHEVGLAGMAQRLGEMGIFSGGEASTAPAGTVEFPDTDFGEASSLPGTELGAPAELGAPETIPELPPPALPE